MADCKELTVRHFLFLTVTFITHMTKFDCGG